MESEQNGRVLDGNDSLPEESTQFVEPRMNFDQQLMNGELLPSSGVVDETEYLQTYSSEDILPDELTEEDRNLAAALVAVQLVQQQKQQQTNSNAENATAPISTPATTNSETAQPKRKRGRPPKNATANTSPPKAKMVYTRSQITPNKPKKSMKVDSSTEDSDYIEDELIKELENYDSKPKRSLPHKKRIPRKLKTKKEHKCSLCHETFKSLSDLTDHTKNHKPEEQPDSAFKCHLCLAGFSDQLEFFQHLKLHYETPSESEAKPVVKKEKPPKEIKELPTLNCTVCGKNFRRHKSYESHIKDCHAPKEEVLSDYSEHDNFISVGCNDDDDDEDDKSWFKEELRATENDLNEFEARENITCTKCNSIFSTKQELSDHVEQCGSFDTDEFDIKKEKPDKSTKSDKPRKKREKKPKNGILECTECGRIFRHRNSLNYHLKAHTGERAYQCDVCGKGFFAASALKVHMRMHSGDKPYKCEFCGRFFRQWGDLKYHKGSIHSDQKNYQCEYCGKDFARKYSLILHRRIHTGEKNYRCEYCGKCFRAATYLQNHRRIHTGEKPHSCEICGKPFRVRSDMKRHMNTHTRRKNRPEQQQNTLLDSVHVSIIEPTQAVIMNRVVEEPKKLEVIDPQQQQQPPPPPPQQVVIEPVPVQVPVQVPVVQTQFERELESVRDTTGIYVLPILIP